MPEQLNYYIAEAFTGEIFTAGVVRKHQEILMQSAGFKPLYFFQNLTWQNLFKGLRVMQCLVIAFSLPKKATVYFHFPFLAGVYGLLHQILHWRGIRTVALVIDIDGLRDDNPVLLQKEVKSLNRFSCIVAHNEAMKIYLHSFLPNASVLCIQVFDYGFKQAITEKKNSNRICFAGNLSKSHFVYGLHKLRGLEFYLYGENYIDQGKTSSGIVYKGTFVPSALPGVLEGSFGLVWDGPSLDSCNDYLRYNNPHKLSLYLAAGLPVIVWKQSAVATFVIENNIGITVESLWGLEAVLHEVSSLQYQAIQKNAAIVGEHLRQGFYLKSVLDKIQGYKE